MRLLDHHREIENVLVLHGIKPNIEPTNGGHVRFIWTTGNKQHSHVTAKTPSDWRATKNEIAAIRRKLKAAGISPEKPMKPKPNKSSSSDIAALEARIAQLERDMSLLLERLTAPNPQPQGVAPPIVPEAAAIVIEPKVDRRRGKRANYQWLWCVMRYDDFLPVEVIAKACGRRIGPLSVLLTNLKKQGYVENRRRIGWRKHRKVEELDKLVDHHRVNGNGNAHK